MGIEPTTVVLTGTGIVGGVSEVMFSNQVSLITEHGDNPQDARRTDHERLTTGSLATDGEGTIDMLILIA